MSQRPDNVPHRPDGVLQRPGSVPQRPDFLLFWQDIQDISGYPGGATARLRRSLAPCRSSPSGLAQSAKGRWLNARKRGTVATGHRISPGTKKPPLKCQHQQSQTVARSSARVTKTVQRPVDACSGSRSLLSAGGTERGSLTFEGRWLGFFLGVQLVFSSVRKAQGKYWFCAVESERKPVGKSGFIATLQRFCTITARFCRFGSDCGAIADK